jgi:hypothetical protein
MMAYFHLNDAEAGLGSIGMQPDGYLEVASRSCQLQRICDATAIKQ